MKLLSVAKHKIVAGQLPSLTRASLGWSVCAFLGFIVALWLGSVFLPGSVHEGAAQPEGTRIKYKRNGLYLFLCVAVVVAAGWFGKLFSLSWLHAHFVPLCIAANLFAFSMSALLGLQGRRRLAIKPKGSEVKPLWADWFYGVEKIRLGWVSISSCSLTALR